MTKVLEKVGPKSRANLRPAVGTVKPTTDLPGAPKGRDHVAGVNRRVLISPKRPAIEPTKPPSATLDASISDSHIIVETRDRRAIGSPGQGPNGDQSIFAGGEICDGQAHDETHGRVAVAADDQKPVDNQYVRVISTIRELWKNRQAWHRAEKSLTLQGKAQCRRFTGGEKIEANRLFAEIEEGIASADGQMVVDHQPHYAVAGAILPFIEARGPLEMHRKAIEKELAKLAKTLPIYEWATSIKGFGVGSLAAIVGEAGDLSNYTTVSKLWKRMGLAVMSTGERQRRFSDPILALEAGYSPSRRSVMFNIGGGLIGGMGKGPRPRVGENIDLRDDLSPYQKRFVNLLRAEVERVTDTWNGIEHKREPVERKGELYESFSSHAANRIRRRIEKEFLCDLWVAWRGAARILKPKDTAPLDISDQTTQILKPILAVSD